MNVNGLYLLTLHVHDAYTMHMKYIQKASIHIRPTCANWGCDKPVAHCGTRYRPVCDRCHRIGYTTGVYPPGITPFRTGYCSNKDGHLGFVCCVNYQQAPWAKGKTQIDHKDGNHLNNKPSNLDELCSLCHQHKGMLNGDFKQRGVYYYKRA